MLMRGWVQPCYGLCDSFEPRTDAVSVNYESKTMLEIKNAFIN